MNDIADVVMRWGELRKGMLVRLHWTGDSAERPAGGRMIGEIIAQTADALLHPVNQDNKLTTGPWKIFLSVV